MMEQRERLTLGLETGQGVAGTDTGLDDLERDFAPDGLGLLGEIHEPHAALAEEAEDSIRTERWRHGSVRR